MSESDSNKSDSDPGSEIWFLNRSVVTLRPKGPFVRWVTENCGATDAPSRKSLESEATAFLIPDFDWAGEAHAWVTENCSMMFDIMLSEWITTSDCWPPDREWPVFREWFKIEHIDVAWDLVDEPLSSDPPGPIDEDGSG